MLKEDDSQLYVSVLKELGPNLALIELMMKSSADSYNHQCNMGQGIQKGPSEIWGRQPLQNLKWLIYSA